MEHSGLLVTNDNSGSGSLLVTMDHNGLLVTMDGSGLYWIPWTIAVSTGYHR